MIKLIDYLASKTGIENKSLLEKDVLLHMLLCELSENPFFKNNLVFKGGTCLIKCYLGYYRFSEDLDFSWVKQDEFEGKSQKEIRRILSKKISEVTSFLEIFSKKNNLDFKANKSDKRYIEIGGSNRQLTCKIWYRSAVLNIEQFIKIQINFVEIFQYPFKRIETKSVLTNIDESKELSFLFPEYAEIILKHPKVSCYDIREIFTEKVRAVLTRRGIKARDFIDLFLISKKEKINLKTIKFKVLEKTRFMMRYQKYIQNLKDFRLEKFVLGEEEKLMLRPIGNGFGKFLKNMHAFLIQLAEELKSEAV
ncbi:hypothetical protein COT48_00640 [Candidatus Woesearchaeota archaeon CG08_land_8_20_14_0_20_47_9]|nr:MAG: hypothetical protein COT48_00640 [Candidatus Woesearchaeota archaeon CG08_land_8_20_14_0_20_47_9]